MKIFGGKRQSAKSERTSRNWRGGVNYYRPTVSTRDMNFSGEEKLVKSDKVEKNEKQPVLPLPREEKLRNDHIDQLPRQFRDEYANVPKNDVEFSRNVRELESDRPVKFNATLSAFHHDAAAELSREKIKKLRLRRRRLGILFLIVAVVAGLGLLLLSQFNESFNRVVSNAPNLSASDEAKYEKLVNSYFAKNPFERFNFARRGAALTSYVTSAAPEVSAVQIASSSITSGELKLTFRKPVAMWTSSGSTSYVDSDGVVFQQNYFAEPSVSIVDDSGVTSGGGVVTSAQFLSFVGQVTADLAKNGGGTVERVVIPQGAIRYVNLYLAGRSYPFMAQIDRDPSSQAADIAAMVRYIDANHITPQYVDVRVAGKAFWK